MPELANRVALVTGAGSGIGKDIAALFAEHGAKVLLADINLAAAEATREELVAAGGDVLPVRVDVTDEADVANLLSRVEAEHGRLDVLVNCAGVRGPRALISELDGEEWQRILQTNLTGTFNLMKHTIPVMQKANSGVILTIGSITAQKGETGHSVYGVSKAGVLLLTKVAALETAGSGVRVNCIAPGYVDTPMINEFTGGNAARTSFVKNLQPIRRLVTTREVAETALFLAGDRATAITGAVIPIDGGLNAL